MKYVILIHSNPSPWGHPTGDFDAEYQAAPEELRARLEADFDALMAELTDHGELVGGEALGDPTAARVIRWGDGQAVVTDGPYAEAKEHFAGFFVVDVESADRAEAIAARFGAPGHTVELRSSMGSGGDDV